MYDDKFVRNETVFEHIGKKTYFRDVHLFIKRARDIVAIKNIEIIRENLWMSLRGIALKWWTIKLFVIEKRIIRLKNDVEKWIILLIDKFKEFITIIIDVVLHERYIMRDAISRRESRKYI